MTTTSEATETKNPLLALQGASRTDVGKKREENQDSLLVIEKEHFRLYMVADGMGGAKGGAEASQLALRTIEESVGSKDKIGAADVIQLVHRANESIFNRAADDQALAGMGTTFVALLFIDTALYVIHVGDSRAYRLRAGELTRLTEDHTLVTELVRSGAITEDQAQNHPVAHMLTRSLGPTAEVIVDCGLSPDGPVRDDVYLLCSDGLYNMVDDTALTNLLKQESLEDAAKSLVEAANQAGGTDNISVVLVRVGKEYPVGLEDIEVYYEETPGDEDEQYVNGHTESVEDTLVRDRKTLFAAAAQMQAISQDPPTKVAHVREGFFSFLASPHIRDSVAVVALLLAGGLIWNSVSGIRTTSDTTTVASSKIVDISSPSELAPIQAKPPVANDSKESLVFPYLTTELTESDLAKEEPAPPLPALDNINVAQEISGAEKEKLTKRLEEVRNRHGELEKRLLRLNAPLTGDLGDTLKGSNLQIEEFERSLKSIRDDVDVATRRLTVWFERKKRLDTDDPINIASEVSVSSQRVKSKKEEFEAVTWEYLKEVELLRYKPTDKAQDAKVSELVKIRNEKLQELTAEVRRAIDEEIDTAQQQISDVTSKRDEVESELGALKTQIEETKVIMGTNPEAKDTLRAEIERDLQNTRNELAELERLVGE